MTEATLTPDAMRQIAEQVAFEVMVPQGDPDCEDCHGTGWFDNDGCVGRCDCRRKPTVLKASRN